MSLLEVSHLQKIYTTRFGGNQVEALKNVSFSVEPGEYVAIMGESGSGKTTLLNILAALDKPTSGQVLLSGKAICDIKERDMDPNTKATAKRTLTLTFNLTPDDDRTNVGIDCVVKSKLASTNPVTTSLYVTGREGTGEVCAVENVPQIPGQTGMDGSEQEAAPMREECEVDARMKFELGVIPPQLAPLWMSKHGYSIKTDNNVNGYVPVMFEGGDQLED